MFHIVCIACADDGIGRFDKSMLSQQTLMELFIFGLDAAEDICGSRDDPREVCTWKGIKCNADGEVEAFLRTTHIASGTIDFKFLPCSMTGLIMVENNLSGTIELADLPENMRQLQLCPSSLSGSLRLDDLPVPMGGVFLGQNAFSGEISLKRLPKGLRVLNLSMNKLQGTICLTSLPPVLETMYLNENMFDGSLDLTRLPEKLHNIRLNDNRFSGEIDLSHLPAELWDLDAGHNRLVTNPTKGHLSVVGWTSTPVWGKPRTFLNPSSCFCHGADPIDGHRKVVGQDQYPALGEVRETAKLLPRGQSPWWRDEGRHLLILCLFSIRGMRLAHMHNAKSREHAHTCRKARAIFKLRYKNKTKQ